MADGRMKPWAKFPMDKKPKYGNVKTEVDGIKFDSKKEAKRWLELKAMEQRGEINGLQRQVSIVILPKVVIDGRTRPATRYVPDFCYHDKAGVYVVEDVKSKASKTPVYELKRKLLKHSLGLDVTEI